MTPSAESDAGEPTRYGLLMPFIACKSLGGRYEDEAFVAGARFGKLAAELEARQPDEHQSYEYPAMIPQLDLLAMHLGYRLEHEPWDEHPDNWTLVTFTRPVSADGGDERE